MNSQRKKSLARWTAVSSGILVGACALYLTVSYFKATRQEAEDKVVLKAMEAAVQYDFAISLVLTAEREFQTNRSLERSKNDDLAAWLLTITAIAFLASMNWKLSMETSPALSFDSLKRFREGSGTSPLSTEEPLWNIETTEVPEIDLSFIEQIVEQEGRDADAAIPILRAVQHQYGYLPDEALKRVCELTEITPAQIAGTSTFYSQFRRSPAGKHLVKICHGTACHVSGAVQVTEELERYLAIPKGEDTDPSRTYTLEKVACLGCCSLAPAMMVDDHTVGRLTPAGACRALHTTTTEKSA